LDKLKKEHGAVRILLSDKFYQKSQATAIIIEKFDKVDGTPKADFKIVDEDSEPFIFISHKDGKTAKDFQQYGGISDSKIFNHPEVVAFVEKMKSINIDFSELPVGGREFAVIIKDPKLAAMSIFGADLGGSFGLKNSYTLSISGASDGFLLNKNLDSLIQDNFDGSLNANIQRLRMYDRDLNPTEVKTNYNYFSTRNLSILENTKEYQINIFSYSTHYLPLLREISNKNIVKIY
jgi:hypothetical protein